MFGIEFLLNEEHYACKFNLPFLYDCYDKMNLHSNIFLENVRETPIVIDFLKCCSVSLSVCWQHYSKSYELM